MTEISTNAADTLIHSESKKIYIYKTLKLINMFILIVTSYNHICNLCKFCALLVFIAIYIVQKIFSILQIAMLSVKPQISKTFLHLKIAILNIFLIG